MTLNQSKGILLRNALAAALAICAMTPRPVVAAAPQASDFSPAANIVTNAERSTALQAASAALPPSSMGMDFWMAVQDAGGQGGSSPHDMRLFIAGENDGTGRLSIADSSFSPISFSVRAGQVTTLTLPGVGTAVNPYAAGPGVSNKGIRLTTTAEVTVYGLNFINSRADGFLAIPSRSAGTEHVVANYGESTLTQGELIVVAQEDSTEVTVTYQVMSGVVPAYPSIQTWNPYTDVVHISAVTSTQIISSMVLNAGQVFVRKAPTKIDYSGSVVQSSKPVVVYGYNGSAKVPAEYDAGDQLLETMPPVSTWGRRFVAVPTPNRNWGDTFRIYAAEASTPVYSNGRLLGTIGRGQWIEHRTKTVETKYFTSTKSIMVQMYINGNGFGGIQEGDPSMQTIQPIEQGMSRYPIQVPQLANPLPFMKEYTNTLNIAAPEAPGVAVYVDGVSVPNLTSTGNGFVTATVQTTPGPHLVTATIPFILSMQGVRPGESYAFPAGMNYVNLSRVSSVTLSPDRGDYLVQNGNRCFVATVKDVDGDGVPGLPVYFYGPTGAIMAGGNADANGNATICYTGNNGDVGLTAVAGWVETTADVRWRNTPSNDVNALDLEVSPGELAPAFVSSTTNYTVSVEYSTTSMLVTPTLYSSGSYTITAAPGACTPATSPANCTLNIGRNLITVTVTAEDGVTKRDYVITVMRDGGAVSNDASLIELDIEPGELSPAFVSTTTSYTAAVPNGTTTAAVTATTSDVSATIAYSSTAGACTPGNASPSDCAIAASGTTTITVTVTAQDGTTKQYEIVVTVASAPTPTPTPSPTSTPTPSPTPGGPTSTPTPTETPGGPTPTPTNTPTPAPLTTISLVWPNLGVPEGGMPVALFGTGFNAATGVRVSNTITNVLVPFTITSDGRIDFVMPAGVDGTYADITVETASDSKTAEDAFRYMAPKQAEFDGEAGAVITTPNGITITIPPQGVSGMFVVTITPQTPEPGVPGSVLMHVFRLDAMLNWEPLTSLTNPITIALPVDPAIVPTGETPYLWEWVEVESQSRKSERKPLSTLSSDSLLIGGRWTYVQGQSYDAATKQVTVALKPMGLYALSTSILSGRAYWFPIVPMLR
jgi:hypothetical protein